MSSLDSPIARSPGDAPGLIDANFFEMIHQLVVASDGAPPRDRRELPREPFPSIQHIAVAAGDVVPIDSAFLPVRCHDLTRRGFSFLFPVRPEFRRVVIAFGTGARRIFVSAEVTHCAEVVVDASGGIIPTSAEPFGPTGAPPDLAASTRMVLVGCRFLKRLYRQPAQ